MMYKKGASRTGTYGWKAPLGPNILSMCLIGICISSIFYIDIYFDYIISSFKSSNNKDALRITARLAAPF